MKLLRSSVLLLVLLLPVLVFAGEEKKCEKDPNKPKNYRIYGYVKYLLTTNFIDGADQIITDNLIHHRLNVRYYPHKNWTLAVDVRNRFHFGQLVQTVPNFASYLDNDDIYDMSWAPLQAKAAVWHLMLDRAYIDFTKDKWQLTVGRQRINWGINTVWNPNDIFNAFNFYDIDYEERQGSDAVRLQYYTGVASSIEVAGKIAYRKEDVTAALLWKTNKGSYDIQVLGGVAGTDIVLGGGWAGNIKGAGFKGEFTYFHPYEQIDSFGVFTGTIAADYSFKNSLFMTLGYLYNSNGDMHPQVFNLALTDISAKNLSPYSHSILLQASYPITPLWNASLATIYSPGDNALFINPALGYSITSNWRLDAFSQLFFTTVNDKYDLQGNTLLLRIKWSY